MKKKFTARGGMNTPYKRASDLWDKRLGSANTRAQTMTYFSFFCLIVSVISVIMVSQLIKKPRIIPYIIELNAEGEPTNYGKMIDTAYNYTPNFTTIKYHVTRFITDFREISSDIVVIKKNAFDAYNLVTSRGNLILTNYLQQENPLQIYEEITRDVQLLNFVAIAGSDNSYIAEWRETTYNLAGEVDNVTIFKGTFVVIRDIELITEEKLIKNPASIYIDTFVFTEKIE